MIVLLQLQLKKHIKSQQRNDSTRTWEALRKQINHEPVVTLHPYKEEQDPNL